MVLCKKVEAVRIDVMLQGSLVEALHQSLYGLQVRALSAEVCMLEVPLSTSAVNTHLPYDRHLNATS